MLQFMRTVKLHELHLHLTFYKSMQHTKSELQERHLYCHLAKYHLS